MLPIIIGLIAGLKLFGRFIFSMSAWSGAFGVLKTGAKGFGVLKTALMSLATFSLTQGATFTKWITGIPGMLGGVLSKIGGSRVGTAV